MKVFNGHYILQHEPPINCESNDFHYFQLNLTMEALLQIETDAGQEKRRNRRERRNEEEMRDEMKRRDEKKEER